MFLQSGINDTWKWWYYINDANNDFCDKSLLDMQFILL